MIIACSRRVCAELELNPATADQPQENRDDGNDQEDVNQSTQGVGGQEAKNPQNDQQNRNRF